MYSRHGKLKVFRDIPLIIRGLENEENDFVRNFYFQSNVLNIDTVQRLEYLDIFLNFWFKQFLEISTKQLFDDFDVFKTHTSI